VVSSVENAVMIQVATPILTLVEVDDAGKFKPITVITEPPLVGQPVVKMPLSEQPETLETTGAVGYL